MIDKNSMKDEKTSFLICLATWLLSTDRSWDYKKTIVLTLRLAPDTKDGYWLAYLRSRVLRRMNDLEFIVTDRINSEGYKRPMIDSNTVKPFYQFLKEESECLRNLSLSLVSEDESKKEVSDMLGSFHCEIFELLDKLRELNKHVDQRMRFIIELLNEDNLYRQLNSKSPYDATEQDEKEWLEEIGWYDEDCHEDGSKFQSFLEEE